MLDSQKGQRTQPELRRTVPKMQLKEEVLEGRSLVGGICIGNSLVINDIGTSQVNYINNSQIESEVAVLYTAVKKISADIDSDENRSDLEKIHKKQILCHKKRLAGIEELIRVEKYSCATAIRILFRQEEARFANEDSADLLPDLIQIRQELECAVTGKKSDIQERLRQICKPFILCAQNLSTDTVNAALESGFLVGICIGDKGYRSHFRIVAQSNSIPVITLERSNIAGFIDEDIPMILDTQLAVLITNPKPETFAHYEHSLITDVSFDRVKIVSPLLTVDKKECHVLATISKFEGEAEKALETGAEGLGLIRSEMAFFSSFKGVMPSQVEDELTEKYIALFKKFSGKSVQIRTFDFVEDKGEDLIDELLQIHLKENRREANDSVHIANYFIAPQIRAILRASAYHDTASIYFPQIGTAERFQKRSNFVEKQKGVLDAKGESYNPKIQLGAMVESVEGLFNIEKIIGVGAKFIAIGSNDLLASITGGRRLGDPMFPANAALLNELIRINIPALERKYNVEFSLCGDLAKAVYAPFAIAIGIRKLSSLPTEYGILNEIVSSITSDQCDKLLLSALEYRDEEVIRNLMTELFKGKLDLHVHW